MALNGPLRNKPLNLFTLVMINVIAVDSLRSLSISAEYGLSLVFFYLVALIGFFIPITMIAAELATGWPKIGGIYVWTREAFGERWAFVAIWLQWIYNVVWFPTILAFIAATLAYLINPSLATNKIYMITIMLVLFWGATLSNCFGMKISGIISTFGAIVGTLLPMIMIIGLGIGWIMSGSPTAFTFSWNKLLPQLNNYHDLAFFAAILFGLLGMEMSAVHAEEVYNPQKTYPRALLISSALIFITLMGSSLAITMVIPPQELSLVSGLSDAFHIFFTQFHLNWLEPMMTVAIIIGAICCISAWIIGPSKGLLIAAADGCLPRIFCYTTARGTPLTLLLLQGVIFTLLCSVILLVPNVDSSYWMLSALTAQLAMLVYIFLFAAAIRLRYNRPQVIRTYRIPGGIMGIWVVATLGIMTCLLAIAIGFLPPTAIKIHNVRMYEVFLSSGILVFCILPLLLYRQQTHHR